MGVLSLLVSAIYLASTCVVALFALHEMRLLLWFWRRHRAEPAADDGPVGPPGELPFVTVQLPLYNERFTAKGAIEAAAALDYPRDRLQIQVLDDSTDETRDIVDRAVAEARARGVDIEVVRRTDRTGFKAGALQAAMPSARGQLLALFDADFVPPPEFLRVLLEERRVFDDPRVGFVQTRWEFTNRHQSRFAEIQAMLLDRHFFLQKPVRERAGCVTVFNGSAGLWRRATIEDAGGWSSDTLTEDLDLSFRAALRGWRGRYVHEVWAGSQLPLDMLAFKLQQRRWAKGSSQCLAKLVGPISRSNGALRHKLDELVMMAGYSVHLAMLVNLLVWPWAVFYVRPSIVFWICQVVLAAATVVGPCGFLVAVRQRGPRPWPSMLRDLLAVTALGFGLTVCNAAAVVSGYLSRDRGTFERTPKLAGEARAEQAYGLRLHWSFYLELATVAYCALAVGLLWADGLQLWSPPLLLTGACLLLVVFQQWTVARGSALPGRSGAAVSTGP